jgi:hypothetical protein
VKNNVPTPKTNILVTNTSKPSLPNLALPRISFSSGSTLFVIGLVFMLLGLFYDTTVPSDETFSLSRTHNIGKISDRSAFIEFGGFLAVCGAIERTRERLNTKRKKT